MNSTDKRLEVAQQLIHEKQEEIDYLERKLLLLMRATLLSLTLDQVIKNTNAVKNHWLFPEYHSHLKEKD